MAALEPTNNAPPELTLPEVPLTLDFHPHESIIAVGLIDGSLHVNKYSNEAHDEAFLRTQPVNNGKHSVRAMRFSNDGERLFVAGADHSLSQLNAQGTPEWRSENAHRDALSALHVIDEKLVATGDDSGAVKLWDVRQAQSIMAFDTFQDYVSDFAHTEQHSQCLIATSGDGSLAAYDMRKPQVLGHTGELEEDLLSVQFVCHGQKIVCGTSEGVVLFFNYGNWDGALDSFPGHPQSIDGMLKLNENTLLTGSSDGMIRVIGIMPNKLYGLVGDHEGFPVERMRWSGDRNVVGTTSHDNIVRFWDVAFLHEEEDEEQAAADAPAQDMVDGDATSPELLHSMRENGPAEDDDDSEEWEDADSDDSDDEPDQASKTQGTSRKPKPKAFQSSAERFFSDL